MISRTSLTERSSESPRWGCDVTAVVNPWEVPGPPSTGRRRKHELVAVFREVLTSLALVDSEQADQAHLDRVLTAGRDLAAQVAGLPSLAARGGPQSVGGADGPLVERGPLSGLSNPLAPPMTFTYTDGEDVVRATATFSDAYEGSPGCVHGGFVLAAFDELLAAGQLPSGGVGMTGTVTVRLRAPMPLGHLVEFEAGTDRVEGRKVFTWARASCRGTLVADAEAICILLVPGTSPTPALPAEPAPTANDEPAPAGD